MERTIIKASSKNLLLPAKAGDAGHDLTAISNPIFVGTQIEEDFFSCLDYIEYDTGVAVEVPDGVYTLVYPRSSISGNTNLVLANSVGVIDNGYRNTIRLRFKYIPQPRDFRLIHDRIYVKIDRSRIYKKGDRVGQAVFANLLPTEISFVSSKDLSETERGQGGFGHTGK